MGKNSEMMRRLSQEDREWVARQGNDIDQKKHYSQKGSHKERSVANNPRKKSKRRG